MQIVKPHAVRLLHQRTPDGIGWKVIQSIHCSVISPLDLRGQTMMVRQVMSKLDGGTLENPST